MQGTTYQQSRALEDSFPSYRWQPELSCNQDCIQEMLHSSKYVCKVCEVQFRTLKRPICLKFFCY